MKEKKNSLAALLFAFASILVGWLISQHFTDLVAMWKQAKAKISGADNAAPLEESAKQKVNNEFTE